MCNTFAPICGNGGQPTPRLPGGNALALREGLDPEGAKFLYEVSCGEPPRRLQWELQQRFFPPGEKDFRGGDEVDGAQSSEGHHSKGTDGRTTPRPLRLPPIPHRSHRHVHGFRLLRLEVDAIDDDDFVTALLALQLAPTVVQVREQVRLIARPRWTTWSTRKPLTSRKSWGSATPKSTP